MKQTNEMQDNVNTDQLISRLKYEDKRYSKISKSFQIGYWILTVLLLFFAVQDYISGGFTNDTIGSICFSIGMLIFALLFRAYFKEYRNIDYSESTLVMLKKAAYRYKPLQLKILWAVLAIFFVDFGLVFEAKNIIEILWIQIFFFGALLIAVAVGLLIWKNRYKPLRDNALSLIQEIEK